MKKNQVKNWMTSNPLTITQDENLPSAHRLMVANEIRRLPVVDDDNRLIGIVTLGDLREATPSEATSLNIYEINYLLTNLNISGIMTKNPISISPEESLYFAAKSMLENKIGGLPALVNGKVVGIITESDIFRAVMEIFE